MILSVCEDKASPPPMLEGDTDLPWSGCLPSSNLHVETLALQEEGLQVTMS